MSPRNAYEVDLLGKWRDRASKFDEIEKLAREMGIKNVADMCKVCAEEIRRCVKDLESTR